MFKEASWKEFRDSGLFGWINATLHLLGWALVAEAEMHGTDDEKVIRVYPARTRFRGFDSKRQAEIYRKVTEHLAAEMPRLLSDVRDEE